MKAIFRITALCAIFLCAAVILAWLMLKAPKEHPTPPRLPAGESTSPPSAPSPSDGKGTAAVVPDADVVASSPNTWKIVYTVAETGIASGGGVVFHIPPFWGWTPPQNQSPVSPGFITVSCSNLNARLDIMTGGDLNYVMVRILDTKLFNGDTITLVYGDTQGGKNPIAQAHADWYAESNERFFIKVDGDGDSYFFPIKEHPTINILSGLPSRLVVTAPSHAITGEPFTIKVAAVDRAENWIRTYNGSGVTLVSDPAGATFSAQPAVNGAMIYVCTLQDEGIHTFHARNDKDSTSGKSNPIICRKEPSQMKLFWADLHGHSQLSDGTGTAEDYYKYARYVAGLDAAALTDHDCWGFDMLDEHPDIWAHIKTVTQRANAPGEFITFMGYEWTSWVHGHKHILFLDEPAPLLSSRDPNNSTPAKLWKNLETSRALSISHHVGGGPVAADWSFYNPRIEPLVEICSIHGNSERTDAPNGIYNPKEGCFVQDALGRGYRLGIVASGDTHNGHPGMGDIHALTGGIMGIYAEYLTREALWDAMKKRRVYGTSGDRIILDFKINGHFMGEVVQEELNSNKKISVSVNGTDRLKHIEVVKNNNVLQSWEGSGNIFNHVFKDLSQQKPGDFYYLRVIQESGGMAWTSPIWFE